MKQIENFDIETTILLNTDEYHNISLNEPLCLYGSDLIIKDLLDNLLSNKIYYNKLISIAKSKNKYKLIFAVEKNNKFYEVSSISLRNLIRYYEKNNNLIINLKINKLKKLMDFNNLLTNNKILNFNVDNKLIQIKETELVNLLISNKENYNKLFINICQKYKISKEILLYILKSYVDENNIFQKYYFTNSQIFNYNEQISYFKNDFESINKYLFTKDSISKDFDLDKELVNIVFKSIPNDYNLLEKSIYIYYKLCTILTYNEELFINNSLLTIKEYANIERLSKINQNNNKIVCYEFASIYGKMLNILGINYNIEPQSEKYGISHTYLTYRTGKYIIKSDPIISIIGSDLSNIKIGNPSVGIECKNINIKSILEFEKIKTIIYKKMVNEFNENREYKTDNLSFDTYKKLTGINQDIKRKIVLLVDELHKSNLPIMDLLSYLLTLKKRIFSEEELDYNINFCIISENLENNRVKPTIILTVNNKDYYEEANKYFILEDTINEIDEERLKELFSTKKYEYIDDNINQIPRISENNVNMKLHK